MLSEWKNLAGPLPSLLWLFFSDLVSPLSFLRCLASLSDFVSPHLAVFLTQGPWPCLSLTISHLSSCCPITGPHCLSGIRALLSLTFRKSMSSYSQLTTLYGSTPIWKKCKFLRPYVSPLGVSHPLPLSPGSLPLQPCTLSMPSSGHLRAFVLAAPSEGNSLHSSHGYILTSPPGDPSN